MIMLTAEECKNTHGIEKNFIFVWLPKNKGRSPDYSFCIEDIRCTFNLNIPIGNRTILELNFKPYKYCNNSVIANNSIIDKKISINIIIRICLNSWASRPFFQKTFNVTSGDRIKKLFELNHFDTANSSIFCEIRYSSYTSIIKTRNEKISDSIDSLLNAEKYYDFTIVAPCEKKLRVHKYILAAQSPVFAAMFENDMKEKIESSVKITDISYDALKEMLRFMYYGKLENVINVTEEIFYAADKYQIKDLKEICLEYLFENINVDNAAYIHNLCIQTNNKALEKLVVNFIIGSTNDEVDNKRSSKTRMPCNNLLC